MYQVSKVDLQGAIRIMLSPNGLDSPGSFIRVDSTGSSPMSRFVNKMNEYLDGNSELDVFSIKVITSLKHIFFFYYVALMLQYTSFFFFSLHY